MANINRAKKAVLTLPTLNAELERYMNLLRAIHPVEIKFLTSMIFKGIESIYVGPGPHLVLQWKVQSRLAARQDAYALANAIASQHKKSYPNLYKRIKNSVINNG